MSTPEALRPIPDDPRPGDFVLTIISGHTGFWVRMAQAMIGDTTKYTHAALVVDEDGTLIEAMPGGARLNNLDHYRGQDVYYHRANYLTEEQRTLAGWHGRMAEGTPYSFADYLALGLTYFGYSPRWLRRYISNSNRMICSQLVDECFRRAGFDMFDDGRLPEDVTPGDLFWFAIRKDLGEAC